MTGGVVVVLGRTGRNFAAGMSGGVAFVLDEDGTLARRCNLGLVELEGVADREDAALLRRLVRQHARLTGSVRARRLLQDWETALSRFVRVIPVEYRQILEKQAAERQQRDSRDQHWQTTRGNGDGRSEGVPEHPARGPETAPGRRTDHELAGVLRAALG
jgi:glutamate synthase domain-containing protein 3